MGVRHVIGIVGIVIVFVLVGVVYDLHRRGVKQADKAAQEQQDSKERQDNVPVVQGTVPNPPPVPAIPSEPGLAPVAPAAQAAQNGSVAAAASLQSAENKSGTEPVPTEHLSNQEVRRYVVEGGDTLYSIARKVYNDSSKWRPIMDANSHLIKDKNRIQKGWTLVIPPLGAAMPPHRANAAAYAVDPAFTYTVQPGDTLASIAQKVLKNPAKAKVILALNKDRIKNPENLPAGLVLDVPAMSPGN